MTITELPVSPTVSVIVANYNGAAHLADCLVSLRRQTLRDIEILVSDDASVDDSVTIVTRLMAEDPRIRLITDTANSGPAAARNKALKEAKGKWVAVVDSDDFVHPARFETLLRAANEDHADVVADDLLMFDSDYTTRPRALLKERWAKAPFWVDMSTFVRSNQLYSSLPCLGYLKPMIRSPLLSNLAGPYNESLRIGEDYDLVVRLLISGARFRVYPTLHYFYRRHSTSISYRLNDIALCRMLAADSKNWQNVAKANRDLTRAIESRERSIKTAIVYERLLEALKGSEYWHAIAIAFANPRATFLLRLSVAVRLRRLLACFKRPTPQRASQTRQVCIISRQRIVGRTNGSSTYLLDIVSALVARGMTVHFLSPSPATLGRWPYLAIGEAVSVFSTFRIRGTWRVGRYVISKNPLIFMRGGLATVEKKLINSGIFSAPLLPRAPYSIGVPFTRVDQLFIARLAPRLGDYLLADYCFLTDAFPYALRPDARTAVIMHDLFSGRAVPFETIDTPDSVAALTEDAEIEMLAKADCIIAVQSEEAAIVRRHLPYSTIIVVPIAGYPVSAAQPGDDNTILFVGSNTAPNADGLRWFLETCWPLIHSRRPDVRFRVAGTVTQPFGPPPPGVTYMGLVAELAPLYKAAGVVVSPLRAGSGLKVKLIEALEKGKAIVASPTTLQGVADLLRDVVRAEETPEGFANAVIALLDDKALRIEMAAKGLAAISRNFSPDKAYEPLISQITSP